MPPCGAKDGISVWMPDEFDASKKSEKSEGQSMAVSSMIRLCEDNEIDEVNKHGILNAGYDDVEGIMQGAWG